MDGPIRLIDGEEPFDGPEPADPLAMVRAMRAEAGAATVIQAGLRPVAVCIDGEIVWTEMDQGSPEAALMRYFAGLARQQLAKLPSPNAKPALSGLTKTAGAHRGPGWCDE